VFVIRNILDATVLCLFDFSVLVMYQKWTVVVMVVTDEAH